VGGFQVRFDNGQDVSRGEGVEVEGVLYGDTDGVIVH
jgi:hypothetical protein